MRPSASLLRPRVKLAFGEKRPVSVHKKKRVKHVHWASGNGVYMPGKNSPLYPLVEEARAKPESWWRQQHSQAPGVQAISPEEVADSRAREAELERMRADKRAQRERERQGVVRRTAMLEQLDREKAPLVAAFLAQQQQSERKKRSKYMD
jgi:hypothetical protein